MASLDKELDGIRKVEHLLEVRRGRHGMTPQEDHGYVVGDRVAVVDNSVLRGHHGVIGSITPKGWLEVIFGGGIHVKLTYPPKSLEPLAADEI